MTALLAIVLCLQLLCPPTVAVGVPAHTVNAFAPRPAAPPVWPVSGWGVPLPAMWFGANTSGFDSPETLALLSRHAVAGFGWQQGPTAVGLGEVNLARAAMHARDYFDSVNNTHTLLFVYRQIQVALRLFEENALAADNPENDMFWYHDAANASNVCTVPQAWGTADPYWNWSVPAAVDFWIANPIAELAAEAPTIAGVFFDEVDESFCGYSGGTCKPPSAADQVQLQRDSNAMLQRLVSTLNAAGIVPILSLDNRFLASGDNTTAQPPCALPEDEVAKALEGLSWARFYEVFPGSFWVPNNADLYAAMIANAIIEGEHGIPIVTHFTKGGCPAPARNITRPGPLGGPMQWQIAMFLTVRTETSVFSMSDNWYDENFCWRPEFDVDYGQPVAPAVRTGVYTWTRQYTRSNVTLNLQSSPGSVVFLF
eukprot:TRINITY_DN31098_c0_g1_i1.p1 TRINITY_DN31098_c0_g1~~TRINITY_DN31098_c0_g1_i1.p1  ORF type:complete len:426 (+),score=102.24 TRINITY_DN31098_c0_g1_i1:301-1578(+)